MILGVFGVFVDSLDIDSAPISAGFIAVISPCSVIIFILPLDRHVCYLGGSFDDFLLLFDDLVLAVIFLDTFDNGLRFFGKVEHTDHKANDSGGDLKIEHDSFPP